MLCQWLKTWPTSLVLSLPAGWQRLVELGYAELRPIGSEKKVDGGYPRQRRVNGHKELRRWESKARRSWSPW